MIVVGGSSEQYQISRVYPQAVLRIGSLPWPFYDGRCQANNGVAYLCFSKDRTGENNCAIS